MQELYNSRDFVAGEQLYTNTFDISFFPNERGPYNVNSSNETPLQRWAGLMRPISVSNFVNSNIEYVEFWMMDPYADGKNLGADPKILLHLGNVSEDVLKDVGAPHPDEVIFAAPAGSVMIYNAHAWHGGTTNREGSRRRVLHGLYIDRADTAQQDQRRWLTPETASRLTPAQKWLLDVE